ncbi:hypothetical protein JRQ81_002601, partial [Phrynocephalus forsythii]
LQTEPTRRIHPYRGLSFCPTKPTQKIQLCRDLEAYFRRLRLKEFFHNNENQNENTAAVRQYTLQDVEISQQHEDTTTIPPVPQHHKKNSTWTPPEGRNKELDLYIECFRPRARTEIINKEPHLT